ncbi:MAG: DUF3344 domain-containing protein [Methanomicrobiaceae archaeon]|nr:DUF3344 domain-containing protein [Methanomicrobiaceae archaeon]
MKTTRQCMLTGMLVLMVALAMVTPVSADPYLGGDPLVTANGTSGTVSGGLWIDAYGGFEYANVTPIEKEFNLPFGSNDVEWARLYVAPYIGHMQNNYSLNTTVEFDGTGLGNYELLGSEIMDTNYVYPQGSGADGTIWFNDHFNRVTSDCLMWYDVTDEINSSNVVARVQTHPLDDNQPKFDGRVKMIALVVAYNDGDSDQIHYWVNQGHDTDSYLADNNNFSYVGETDFSTSDVLFPGEANLTAIYLGSYNANYTFNNNVLPWANPQIGTYLGAQSWNVTDYISGDSVMTFDRNATHSGDYSGYFKIPLALLTVEE